MQTTDRHGNEWRPQRPLRWYEWLLVLLLLVLANGVRAGSVYKCIGAGGAVAYQDLPCAADRHERMIELEAAPAYAPSPEYAFDRETPKHTTTTHAARSAAHTNSFECRSADGQVFFRHGGCPHSVPAGSGAASPPRNGSSAHGSAKGAGSVSVSARRIDRDEACRQIHRAGSIGRAGHQHDEDVGTYERNLGRDPCR
jgi:hypothetical protein